MGSKYIRVKVEFVMIFDAEQEGISPEMEATPWVASLHETCFRLGATGVMAGHRTLSLMMAKPKTPRSEYKCSTCGKKGHNSLGCPYTKRRSTSGPTR